MQISSTAAFIEARQHVLFTSVLPRLHYKVELKKIICILNIQSINAQNNLNSSKHMSVKTYI